MTLESPVLKGKFIRLEPLDQQHIEGLAAASAADPALYRWSPVPQGISEAARYVITALEWREAGIAIPFAIVRAEDGAVIGSSRLWNLEQWAWPVGHPMKRTSFPDVCEIGYSWLTASAVRTGANSEAKLLMMTYAFETWKVLRICFHADVRNERSRTAIERIGGRFEGILRSHRMAVDFIARDSARYSILASEWPEAKEKLAHRLYVPK